MERKDPVSMAIDAFDASAEDYHRRNGDISVIKPFIDRFIGNLVGKSVLDIGCGPGRDAAYLSGKGLEVTGIDLSTSMLAIAASQAPKARLLVMDMRHLTFPDASFDGIWACASFLFIPKSEAQEVLKGIIRVLRKGGLLFIAVKKVADEGKKYRSYYAVPEFIDLLDSCGLQIISVESEEKRNIWINVFASKP